MLKAQGGAGTVNPETGALEFRDESYSPEGGPFGLMTGGVPRIWFSTAGGYDSV